MVSMFQSLARLYVTVPSFMRDWPETKVLGVGESAARNSSRNKPKALKPNVVFARKLLREVFMQRMIAAAALSSKQTLIGVTGGNRFKFGCTGPWIASNAFAMLPTPAVARREPTNIWCLRRSDQK